ncbi:hypothetical protein [Altererythrobacter sp. C41]|uniref:hypothetical protein n=1 Tax=Altererythrobacter sp. C41 TaxID=2806021 RepID=UPI0019332FCC|nr:hypothetical protein [Altererythrobacter sp. C41]MBM0169679.1 hypothetical protein [Altererythrobacter sp. C41]
MNAPITTPVAGKVAPAPGNLAGTNPANEIYRHSTDVQILCTRARSLARAIDTAADEAFGEESPEVRRRALNLIVDFASMLEREAEDAIAKAERIEILSRAIKLVAEEEQ